MSDEEPKKEPEKKTKSSELVEKANEAAERLEEANKKHEELLSRQEALQVENTLAGKAEAGEPQKKEKLDDREYANAVEKGEADPFKEDGYV